MEWEPWWPPGTALWGKQLLRKGDGQRALEMFLKWCQSYLNQMRNWRWLRNIGLERDLRLGLCRILSFRVQTHQRFWNADIITIRIFRKMCLVCRPGWGKRGCLVSEDRPHCCSLPQLPLDPGRHLLPVCWESEGRWADHTGNSRLGLVSDMKGGVRKWCKWERGDVLKRCSELPAKGLASLWHRKKTEIKLMSRFIAWVPGKLENNEKG